MFVHPNGPVLLVVNGFWVVGLAFAFRYCAKKIAPALIVKLDLASGSHWNPNTSIETRIRRDDQGLQNLIVHIVFSVSLLVLFLVTANLWPTVFWYITLSLSALYAIISGILLLSTVKDSDIEHCYYPQTKEFYQFHLAVMFREEISDEARAHFETITPDNPDYPVAQQMWQRFHDHNAPKKIDIDYISGGDPTIQYGPETDEQRAARHAEYDSYDNSDMRIG